MKPERNAAMAVLAIVVVVAGTAGAYAENMLHARISYDVGGGLVRGREDDEWSFASLNTLILPGDTLWADDEATLEVEMAGGSFLRLADGSKVEVVQLPPDILLNGWTGSFYLQRARRSTGSFVFRTPACTIEVERDTMARVDIVGEGATTVSVHWGQAKVRTEVGSAVTVKEGRRTFIDPGFLPSTPLPFDRTVEDSFDIWNRERGKLLALGTDAIPSSVSVVEEPVGYTDLSGYGEWVRVEREYYWRPTVVVDYVPYRYGHWSYMPAYGYVWV
ncbi:MAG: FecR domain-containing protein, partial [Candidatus Hydrogenedentes bacterium]|nr:FecR domain-containing protein [Candidatus Hydrogenedentota bacterium]